MDEGGGRGSWVHLDSAGAVVLGLGFCFCLFFAWSLGCFACFAFFAFFAFGSHSAIAGGWFLRLSPTLQ